MSPKKPGGFQGQNSIAAIMAKAGDAFKKGGLTIGSKEMKKLDKGLTGSRSGKSVRSAGTRRTGSKSKKSEHEDFENMDIDEINGLVKQCEDGISEAQKAMAKVEKKMKNSLDSNKKKET